MLKEIEYTFGGNTYLIKELPLGKSQEVLIRLMKLMGTDGDETSLASLPAKLTLQDVEFFREKLLGEHCLLQNDSGNWVPLGKAVTDNHFAGKIGRLFHLLGKCLVVNYASFLDDLALDDLVQG